MITPETQTEVRTEEQARMLLKIIRDSEWKINKPMAEAFLEEKEIEQGYRVYFGSSKYVKYVEWDSLGTQSHYDFPIIPIEEVIGQTKGASIHTSEINGFCPRCGLPAYVGFIKVECGNRNCENYI